MDFVFDLQLFGGGESTTTSREIPAQTGNELALENFLLNSASIGGNMAPYAYQAFAGSLNDVFTPNYNDAYGEYVKRMDGNQQGYTNYLLDAIGDYQSAADNYKRDMYGALGDYKSSMDSALAKYNQAADKRSPLWDDLVNGILPSQYAANRQAALNADLKGTMGSAINNLASRGVINSGVGNKALDDISQSASDTLAKRYADDLQLEASLLGQDRANYRDAYDVAANTAQGKYSNSSDAYTNTMNQYANLYRTKIDGANAWAGRVADNTNSLRDTMFGAQQASLSVPTTYLNYADQLMQPVNNLYNTMYSGRMGTGSTTTSTDSSSGIWSAVGGLGSAFVLCFTGDTLVTTPDGYKAISDVQVGDEVLSVHDGKIVPKKVCHVTEPESRVVDDVYWDNGTVWHCTPGQRYFDGKHFVYIGNRHIPAMVHNGEPTRLLRVENTDRHELVYDITLEGFAGENVFFANDVAAEGFGD